MNAYDFLIAIGPRCEDLFSFVLHNMARLDDERRAQLCLASRLVVNGDGGSWRMLGDEGKEVGIGGARAMHGGAGVLPGSAGGSGHAGPPEAGLAEPESPRGSIRWGQEPSRLGDPEAGSDCRLRLQRGPSASAWPSTSTITPSGWLSFDRINKSSCCGGGWRRKQCTSPFTRAATSPSRRLPIASLTPSSAETVWNCLRTGS